MNATHVSAWFSGMSVGGSFAFFLALANGSVVTAVGSGVMAAMALLMAFRWFRVARKEASA